jgi:hypothetical protein
MKKAFFCVLLVLASCVFSLGQTYKVLWSFGGAPNDGANPVSDLVFDKAGNIYGTTQFGGSQLQCTYGCGTVFELSAKSDGSWAETVIYNFCANYPTGECLDGQEPKAGLAIDTLGNLYGTTYFGGPCPTTQCGIAFELSPPTEPGGTWTESVLYVFCSIYENFVCLDGNLPASDLTLDALGNLYGTTTTGGNGAWDGGTVFELSPPSQTGGPWTETVLYNFCTNGTINHCPDGTSPHAGVTFDNAGNLYGTTNWGGTPQGGGSGTVYELSPNSNGWTHTVLIAFDAGDEAEPEGVVSFDAAGNLYSTSFGGGSSGLGGVFRVSRASNIVRAVSFDGEDGGAPTAGILVDQKTGTIYGTNTSGGLGGAPEGAVFEIGKDGKITVLYTFCQQTNCADGAEPYSRLSVHSNGLYGTTKLGGTNNVYGGNGVVFEITPP